MHLELIVQWEVKRDAFQLLVWCLQGFNSSIGWSVRPKVCVKTFEIVRVGHSKVDMFGCLIFLVNDHVSLIRFSILQNCLCFGLKIDFPTFTF